jgi:hypothetical protein
LDKKMGLLAKWQVALNLALRQGRENPVIRAIRILETALNDVLLTLERMAGLQPGGRRRLKRYVAQWRP